MKPTSLPVALTIAGSDSGGGAGIQADLKVFAALGVFCTSAITAVTAQNPRRVARVLSLPSAMVGEQMRAVFEVFDVKAAKTGMLATREIVEVVAATLRARRGKVRLVVDPILRATSGAILLEKSARNVLERELLPLAMVVTPNLDEARAFLRRELSPPDAASELAERWGSAVLLKGGHAKDASRAVDVFCEGRGIVELNEPRVRGAKVHGLGCALSAAITAFLAQGHSVLGSVLLAKKFITRAIRNAENVGDYQVLRF